MSLTVTSGDGYFSGSSQIYFDGSPIGTTFGNGSTLYGDTPSGLAPGFYGVTVEEQGSTSDTATYEAVEV